MPPSSSARRELLKSSIFGLKSKRAAGKIEFVKDWAKRGSESDGTFFVGTSDHEWRSQGSSWQASPRTVEQVREALATAGRSLTHSSVITVMNIMVRKKYLIRAKKGRSFEYQHLVGGKDVGRGLLNDLVQRVFEGSAKAVVLELLETVNVDSANWPRSAG